MDNSLHKAAERLLEALQKETAREAAGAQLEAVAELRHLHGLADRSLAASNSAVAQLQALAAGVTVLCARVGELETALAKQARTQALQAALGLVDSYPFEQKGQHSRSNPNSCKDFARKVLRNALKGGGTNFPADAMWDDPAVKDSYYGGTGTSQAAFRTKFVDDLHRILGIEPVIEQDENGKYCVRIP